MLSKFKLERDLRNRLALMFGGGMQIATTQFHTYNHALVLTARMLFLDPAAGSSAPCVPL